MDLAFNSNSCFLICDNYIDVLYLSSLTIVNNYQVEEHLLEKEYGYFFYNFVSKTKLFLGRLTNKPGMTLFIIDISDIDNLEVWIPFWTSDSIAMSSMVYGLITCSCLLTSMYLRKIVQRKRLSKGEKAIATQ